MKNLLVVDGNSILNRAFYGIRALSTKDGIPTNAVYGFINILKKHIDSIEPEYMVCAFDLHAPTFRHKYFEGYKATRHPSPDDLIAQMPWAHKAALALGFHVIELEGYEADDIIGTAAATADAHGDVHTYILTGDRDSLQLITETTSVILVKTKEDVIYTPDKFISEYGVTPHEFIDVKALMGDSSDNIPGVKGIGEKTALKLIADHSSLENIYADVENLSVGKAAKEKIALGKDSAFMSRYLATIIKDVPLNMTLDDFLSHGHDAKALSELFLRLEFSALYKKFDFSAEGKETEEEKALGEYEYVSCEQLPETLGKVIFVSERSPEIFVSDGNGRYKTELSDENKKRLLSSEVICHDVKSFIKNTGCDVDCAFDTMLATYLISPGQSAYPIDKILFSYLKISAAEISGEDECTAVEALYPVLSEALEKESMSSLLHDIEIPLAKVLCAMETTGMKLDAAGLTAYGRELCEARDEICKSIYSAAGHEFNINSPKQLGQVLFEEMGLPALKKTKSGYSTNVEVLNALKGYSPIVSDILSYRQLAKLISTYADVLPGLTDESSRIHTSFNQTGTATGRLSSNDPNLQNIPVRGELGREIRRYFVADEGKVLIDADYSQIELRVLAEISGDENMKDAFKSGKDIHTSTAAQVFGVSELMVDPELRRRAKAVNFGIVYGIGAFSLSQDLGISRKQADEYIKSYLATYPKVDSYLKNTVRDASQCGYTTTYFGRRRHIAELSSSNKNVKAFGERVAMNSPIQGTAADIIKIAMINVSRALDDAGLDARLIMQVHDELIVEASEKDAELAAEILKREMENTVKTDVPMLAEVSVGKNWFEAK